MRIIKSKIQEKHRVRCCSVNIMIYRLYIQIQMIYKTVRCENRKFVNACYFLSSRLHDSESYGQTEESISKVY